MLLAIDIGNTYITAGCAEGADISCVQRLKTDLTRPDSEYAVLLSRALALDGADVSTAEGAIISSVVPPLTPVMKAAVKKLTGKTALTVGAGIKTGLNIRIDNPAQLGSDLAAGAVAAMATLKPPIVVIVMETATTLTVISEEGRLLGGAILPGAGLSLDALSETASLLPHVPLEAPRSCIGTNTTDCMKSGAVFGAAAAVDGMIERIEAELGKPASVIATGPFAESIIPHCRRSIGYDAALALKGLAIIYGKNKK